MKRSAIVILVVLLAIGAVLVGKHLTAARKTAASVGEAAPGLLPGPELAPSLENGRATMVDFGAGACKVCKELQPVIDATAERYRGKANIVYVDTGLYAAIAKQYRVSLIPTQIFFDSEGNEVFRNVGKISPEEIDRRLAEAGAEL
jgi:thioredoxin 1